jgi:5-methylcytosine-specific restriction endonuclease McrA
MPYADLAKRKECTKKYHEIHKEELTQYKAEWYQANKKSMNKKSKEWADTHRDKTRMFVSNWTKKNQKRKTASEAKRRCSKLQRTPMWSQEDLVKTFYLDCPKDMTVDHIIPLQGNLVSGLHVIDNLQYLTPSENSSKINKYEVNI